MSDEYLDSVEACAAAVHEMNVAAKPSEGRVLYIARRLAKELRDKVYTTARGLRLLGCDVAVEPERDGKA